MRSRICAFALTMLFVAAACDSSHGAAPSTSQIAAARDDATSTTTDTSTTTTSTSTTTTLAATTTTVAVTTTVAPPTSPPAPAPPPTTAPPAPPPPNTIGGGSTVAGCPSFPADNYWHADVSQLPRHPNSDAYVASIGAGSGLKADFGSGLWDGGPIGIPFVTVGAGQAKVPVTFDYADESDPGPYPVPANPPIEGGAQSDGDRHVIVVDANTCRLYELYAAYPASNGSWTAGSGAVYDLRSDAMRPAGWTSADAAGLPILPGLVRYDEVAAGAINHAIRITVPRTQKAFVWPARHIASSRTDANLPPMGLWLRLRADFDISGYPHDAQVILQALKKYGAIVADNGSPWYMSGVPDERWNNDVLQTLRKVPGSAFEAVDTTSLVGDPNSGRVRGT
jgi:hypothetical protein